MEAAGDKGNNVVKSGTVLYKYLAGYPLDALVGRRDGCKMGLARRENFCFIYKYSTVLARKLSYGANQRKNTPKTQGPLHHDLACAQIAYLAGHLGMWAQW